MAEETKSTLEEWRRDQIARILTDLNYSRAMLDWMPEDTRADLQVAVLEQYLYQALWLVYAGKLLADEAGGQGQASNSDLSSLVELGYIPLWPGNPFEDWRPMRVLAPGDEFSPGDLVYDPGPVRDDAPGPSRLSFNLYIYGIDANAALKVRVCEANRAWAADPRGALFGLGASYSRPAE